MADVSGPCSTLPGARSVPPEGMDCDNHPGVPATKRIQGETDSFGAEYLDLCAACAEKIALEMRAARPGVCDWCRQDANDLRHRRDFEEGMSGRVYDVCGDCVMREQKALLAERDDRDDWYGEN